MSAFWIIMGLLGLMLLALAAPVGIAKKSWLWLFLAMVMSFMVVVLPLFVFFFSSFMVPEWKGACRHGWLDCFIVGKLAFTPFVLVATAALYRLEVLREKNPTDRWLVMGIFLGAMVATTCLVFGLMCIEWSWFMLVPLYVAVWYVIRAVQLAVTVPVGFWTYFWASCGTIPSWFISWEWSRTVYESLPDKAPSGCFVVTAAARGHEKFVGPFSMIEHGERTLRANHQLITLWEFENNWRSCAPRSHRNFRCFYNRIGPVIAAPIKSPWLADLIYIALKPVEFAAQLINHNVRRYYELHRTD